MVYKEKDFEQEAILIDKKPQTLKQVIQEMVRCCKIAEDMKQPQDYLMRYQIMNTSKNIVISTKNVFLNLSEYSILVFYEIDQV